MATVVISEEADIVVGCGLVRMDHGLVQSVFSCVTQARTKLLKMTWWKARVKEFEELEKEHPCSEQLANEFTELATKRGQKRAFRELSLKRHPDKGGSVEAMAELRSAQRLFELRAARQTDAKRDREFAARREKTDAIVDQVEKQMTDDQERVARNREENKRKAELIKERKANTAAKKAAKLAAAADVALAVAEDAQAARVQSCKLNRKRRAKTVQDGTVHANRMGRTRKRRVAAVVAATMNERDTLRNAEGCRNEITPEASVGSEPVGRKRRKRSANTGAGGVASPITDSGRNSCTSDAFGEFPCSDIVGRAMLVTARKKSLSLSTLKQYDSQVRKEILRGGIVTAESPIEDIIAETRNVLNTERSKRNHNKLSCAIKAFLEGSCIISDIRRA